MYFTCISKYYDGLEKMFLLIKVDILKHLLIYLKVPSILS